MFVCVLCLGMLLYRVFDVFVCVVALLLLSRCCFLVVGLCLHAVCVLIMFVHCAYFESALLLYGSCFDVELLRGVLFLCCVWISCLSCVYDVFALWCYCSCSFVGLLLFVVVCVVCVRFFLCVVFTV